MNESLPDIGLTKSTEELSELAKGIAVKCIRNNTCLEDFHAEITEFDDPKMKQLMIDIVDNIYLVLIGLYSNHKEATEYFLKHDAKIYANEWNDAKIPDWFNKLSELIAKKIIDKEDLLS